MTPSAAIGLCLAYSMGGANPCTMLHTDRAVYVYDAYNLHEYRNVIGNIYSYSLNGVELSYQFCKMTTTSVDCSFGLKFNET